MPYKIHSNREINSPIHIIMGNKDRTKITGIKHEKHPAILDDSEFRSVIEILPIEIHLLSEGAKDNKPSFIILGVDEYNIATVSQASLKMLNKAFNEVGYELKPI